MFVRPKSAGFTLIELVIVIVIVAILFALALPSYKSSIRHSRRAEGIATLNSIQIQEEKYKTYNNTYGTIANVWNGVTTTDNGYYTLAITNNTATGFIATATAVGDQANDRQNGTACSTLTLTVNGLNTTTTPATCWSQ